MPRIARFALAILAAPLLLTLLRSEPLVEPRRVDAALKNLVSEHGLVGVSGLVYEKGEEVYFGAHGYANREAERKMKRDTLAYIYSMTKPITGVALMTLYEKGAFQLDDPLGMDETRYYFGPEYDERRTRIYVRENDGSFTPEPLEEVEYHDQPRPLKRGGSRLISTLDDYMRFARMLLNEGELDGVRILSPDTIRLMASNALPATLTDSIWLPSKGQVGFGIDLAVRLASPATHDEASGEIGEFFWDGRASTLFWVDPENEIAAVLFAQFLPFNTVPAHKDFRDAIYYHDETAAAPRKK